jgi:hypothetical protein
MDIIAYQDSFSLIKSNKAGIKIEVVCNRLMENGEVKTTKETINLCAGDTLEITNGDKKAQKKLSWQKMKRHKLYNPLEKKRKAWQ